MRGKSLIFAIFFLFFGVGSVLAGDPPILLTPSNSTTVVSSRLEWQTPSYQLYTSNSYRIQVDDDSSFSSINKNYYTNNTYYTPTLSFGTWYWKVKAKDVSGIWSDWSTIWSFILTTSTPSPTPTPTQTPSQTPTPTSSTSPPISSFTLSNVPSQINSDQSFNVSINLTLPDNPNTNFYLKGAFKKADSSNYFGQTLISGNWVKNSSTYSNQYPITTNSSGNWSGNLEIQPDTDDSGYTGSDDYTFKVGRYTSSGSGPTWSNESTIKIISTESNDQGSTSTSTSNNPSTITNPPASSQSVKNQAITSSQPKNYDRVVYRIASVAAASTSATPSAKVEVSNQKQTNPIVWVGLLFIFAGVSLIGYIYLKRNGRI